MTSTNPVQEEARFRFLLPRPGKVELSIYDVSGRRMAEVASGEFESGEHDVSWAIGASKPAAGVYFARFRSGSYEKSVRLVLTP